MACNEIHLGDIGTIIEVTLKDNDLIVNLSGATTKEFYLMKPDKTVLTVNAVFKNPPGDGTDGILQYVTQTGDLDQIGQWKIQAHVIITGQGEWKSDISSFTVHGNLA